MNKCKQCGKDTKNKVFCSVKCKSESMSKPKGNCLNCGKELDRCEVKYCSKECYGEHKSNTYKESLVYNKCIICGKDTSNEKFCSMRCMGKDESRKITATNNLNNKHIWSKEEKQYLTENYGLIDIERISEHLKLKKATIIAYASKNNIKSQRKWTDEDLKSLEKNKSKDLHLLSKELNKSKFSIINKLARLNNFQDDSGHSLISPQAFIRNYVRDELKIPYLEEVSIGKYRTDILIHNLDIEIQGTYWHVDERFFDYNNLTEQQKKRIEKDSIKKKFLESKNIEVLYIWEYDIISNPQKCKQQIIDKLKEKNIYW